MPRIVKNGKAGWFIDSGTMQEIEKSSPALMKVLGLPEPPPVSFAILLFITVGAVIVEKSAQGFGEIEFSNSDNDETAILSLCEMFRNAYDQIVLKPELEKLAKL